MEEEPAPGDWIKLEVEAEAIRARASLIRRVSIVRDQPMLNLTEASAYCSDFCFPLPHTSPVPHAGSFTFTHARAPAPTHLGSPGPMWDPGDAMDCGEDVWCGVDVMTDPPSSSLHMLFTQCNEEASREPRNQCVAADDLPVTKALSGDHGNPACTHHPCLRAGGNGVVVSGQPWTTDLSLAAGVALEGPMRTEEYNPHDMGCPSGGLYPICDDGLVDTPLPPTLTPHALPDEWLDVFCKLAAIPRLPTHENTAAHPSNLLGCGLFSECVEQSRVHAVKIDIDAIESTARSLLDGGLGVDQSMMAGHISTIRAKGMGQALKRMSDQMLPCTLHPRPHLISVPPDRHPPLPVQQHPTWVVKLTLPQRAALEEHCARIPPPPPREA